MADALTLEQVKALAAQLRPSEQLKLVSYIGEQLSAALSVAGAEREASEQAREASLAKAETLLAELDAIAESIPGEFDSARDLREIREQRADRP